MKNFFSLTREDVEILRRKSFSINPGMPPLLLNSNSFSDTEIDAARNHLETIYQGRVYRPFAAKILILNQIH